MRAAAAHLARPRAPATLLRPAAPAGRPLAVTLCSSLRVAPLGAALLGQRPAAHSGVGAGAAGWVQRRFFSEDSEEVPVAAELGDVGDLEGSRGRQCGRASSSAACEPGAACRHHALECRPPMKNGMEKTGYTKRTKMASNAIKILLGQPETH